MVIVLKRTYDAPPRPKLVVAPGDCSCTNGVFGESSNNSPQPTAGYVRTMEDATGHLMPDHLHMMISVPLKYAVSQVIWFIKGKSLIHLVRVYGERKRNFVGQHFWVRGYFVSTVGPFLDFGMVVL